MPQQRQYYIDWLRFVAVFLLVPFHTAMIFVYWDFHIKNNVLSGALTDFNAFLHVWHMPLLFLLSGVGSWFALGFRSPRQYVLERIRRLVVPLVFGILVIIPPQTHLERLQKGEFHGSYWSFYPHFFEGVYPEGNFTWNHLWFLVYLSVFSFLALPLFAHLRSERRRETVARLSSFFAGRGRLLLLALPLMLVEATLRVKWSGVQNLVDDWANFCSYIIVFVYGFLLCSHDTLSNALARQRFLHLGLALVSLLFLATLRWTGCEPPWGYSPLNMAFLAFQAFNTWCWVLAILGLGKAYLDFTNRFLAYVTESILPCYIIHQTVIIIIGYYVVQWNMGVMPKFLFINASSLVIILLMYDGVIKRFNGVRLLFGMKPRTSRTP